MRPGLFTKLYAVAGVLVFIAIGYTYINNHAAAKDTAPAPVTESANQPAANPAGNQQWARDSMNADAYMNRSIELYTRKEYHECIALNRKALALNPRLSTAYNNLCSAYNCLGEWDSAIAACNMAIAIKPDFDLAKNNLNYSYSMKGQAKKQ